MATSYTSLLGFALPVTGELSGTWGDVVNNSITQLVEDSVAGVATTSVAGGNWTLSTTGSGAANEARCAILIPTGSPGVSRNIVAPSQSKAYIVINQSDAAVVVKGSATTGATVNSGQAAVVAWNGSDYVNVSSGDVDGPSSATDNAVARFDGTTGKLIQNSAVTIADTTGDIAGAGSITSTSASGILTRAASTQDGVIMAGRAGGTSSYAVTLTPTTLSASRTLTLPDASGTILQSGTAVTVAQGGTGLTAGTSGGVPYFSSTSAITSSGVLSANQFVFGGGAGASPTSSATVSFAAAFTGANTFYNSTGQTFGTGTSTQDGFVIGGRAGGSSSYRITFTPDTLSASRTVTFPDGGGNYTVGYRNLPAVGTKTGSYSLAVADVGKYVQVSTGGSITIPDATFAEGDVISIFNNTSAGITITCSITTAYISGTDTDKATVTLATRGVATILFISSTVCVISGSVS